MPEGKLLKHRLPPEFLKRMKLQLADEYDAFLETFENKSERGLRINTLKITKEIFERQAPFDMEPVPWIDGGYFCAREEDVAGHPMYRAGLYYIQEPSAMTPADRLEIRPGDKVLDLCAAPGGKSTRLAGKLGGSGLLVSNDINAARCRALVNNLELAGAANIIVTNERPDVLKRRFPEYFDRIMVDAPCSGEGMFRKDPAVIGTWSPERVGYFAAVQREILFCAMRMLRPGGLLMYSTCTFSPEENEGSISAVLEAFPETEVMEIKPYEGFSKGVPACGNNDIRLEKTVRIWPHRMRGEGHFLALLKKGGAAGIETSSKKTPKKNSYNASFSIEERALMDGFLKGIKTDFSKSCFENRKGKVFYMPFDERDAAGLKFMRCGLFAGELKKKRFEPSQAMALYLKREDYYNTISFKASDERLKRYLKGEDTELCGEEINACDGWVLVCAEHFPVGFAKKSSFRLKNKYLRLR